MTLALLPKVMINGHEEETSRRFSRHVKRSQEKYGEGERASAVTYLLHNMILFLFDLENHAPQFWK